MLDIGAVMELSSLSFSLNQAPQVAFPLARAGKDYQLAIMGGGPAGLTAAVYSARKRTDTVLITNDLGGQVLWTSGVENYPGFQYIQGRELIEKFKSQVAQFPIDVSLGLKIISVEPLAQGYKLSLEDGSHFTARSLIIATGKKYRNLNVPGEKELIGKGVAFCATCDAPLFGGKTVAVVGGGNSALTAAQDLMSYAQKIFLINISSEMQGDPVLLEPLKASGKIEFIMEHKVTEILGKDSVIGIRVSSTDDVKQREIELSGVFVEIGLIPNSDLFKGLVDMNQRGEIMVDCACRTSQAGVFAAGDVTTVPEKQIVVAAGEGAKAALSAYEWLARN
jgi:alkyl hydroperoxide reductase subunit F